MTHVINIAFQDRILPDDSPPLYGQRDKEMSRWHIPPCKDDTMLAALLSLQLQIWS